MPAGFAWLTVRNGVTACMMISALSLLAVGAIGPVHALVLAAAIPFGRWVDKPSLPSPAWDVLALITLVLFPIDLFVLSRDLIGSALRLLAFVVIYRCAHLSDHRDLRQGVALSFVQVLAAAASTTESYFVILLSAYLLMAIWTLMAMASAREGAPASARRPPAGLPAAVLTAGTLGVGTVLFFAIPHFGTGYFQPEAIGRPGAGAMTGFSDRIELGSIGRIKRNRAIVMRVRIAGLAAESIGAPLWRGVALDTFDGRSWSASHDEVAWLAGDAEGSFDLRQAPSTPEPAAQDATSAALVEQDVSLQPMMVPFLFSLPRPVRLVAPELPSVGIDSAGSVHTPSPPSRRLSYKVFSLAAGRVAPGPEDERPGDQEMARYLALPRLDPEVAALARRITANAASGFERARLVETYLRENYPYTLEVNDSGVEDPVAHFLLRRNPGHCEYFATSMAVILRHLGMPSRVVNGFTAGEWSSLAGTHVVRQSDAHSWVEAWIAERGWVTFDPTPASSEILARAGLLARLRGGMARLEVLWDTWIVGLDLLDQQSLAASIASGAQAATAAATRTLSTFARSAARWPALLLDPWIAAIACVSLALITLAAAVGRRRAQRAAGLGSHTSRASEASAMLRRLEERWAVHGVRRTVGQTPLELAREIERRALEPPGTALRLIMTYYQARYGA